MSTIRSSPSLRRLSSSNRFNTSCSGTRASITTPPNSGCATRSAPLQQQLSAARGAGANPGASPRTRWWLVERAACRGGAAGVAAGPAEQPGDADRDRGAGGGTGPVDPEVVEAVEREVRAERACGVHRGAADRARPEAGKDDVAADCDGRKRADVLGA